MPDKIQVSNVVTNVKYQGALWDRMCRVFEPANITRVSTGDLHHLKQALDQAEIAILTELLPPSEIRDSRLRWVHITHAGMDRIASPEILARGIRISGSAGNSVEAIAEHALFFMLSLAYRSMDLFDAQRRSSWERGGREDLRSLFGQTVGIVGMGHIGKAVAARCNAMGMQVLGYNRREVAPVPGVQKVFCQRNGDSLDALLAEADYVVLAVPLTNATHGMIGENELAGMKPTAHLINIARGDVVDEPALIRALEAGRIAGAGLDVFSKEPLPAGSPLWTLPNVIVTPHTSPRESDRHERAIDLIADNYERFLAGQPLINELTSADVYTF